MVSTVESFTVKSNKTQAYTHALCAQLPQLLCQTATKTWTAHICSTEPSITATSGGTLICMMLAQPKSNILFGDNTQLPERSTHIHPCHLGCL
jgi:hypothetical protein